MPQHTDQYIGGAWRPSLGADPLPVLDPATEQVLATVPAGGPADVDAAVRAARAAARGWGATTPEQRLAPLTRLRDGLAAAQGEIAATVVAELGCPIGFATAVQAGLPLAVADSYLGILAGYEFQERTGNSTVFAEPVGVVAAITPWNYPLHQIVAKVVPALAAGCTVVLKPAEDTPLVARLFARLVHEAGFPAGVFNLVTGLGPVAGAALAGHPDVDLVSFTGSTAVGRTVAETAGRGIKRVALELGGKSANVVLPGADLARAVNVNVGNVFANSGQTCSAWTRLLVHQDQYEEAVAIAAKAAAKYLPGDPSDPATRVGPVVSAGQRERVRGHIRGALAEGARLVAGGPEAPEGLDTGFYVRPTVLADVTPGMAVAQEEIFGPVLSILGYRDEEHALEIANGTRYGLAGSVWAADEETAVAFARRMDTGQVDINGGRFNPLAPFGGWKGSGLGRELGRHGLEEFLQPKSLQF
ncbi:aldehyde dehydrogenase [Kitasatospora herbaricolor]|uniref:aldehyde dehydrogenase family protein n=1 Tax=Kitasatospora herbaricolor TaxID=68217 RepID=UPI00174E56C4|nr:aldehyde dehydrogenase family protein [Kitasatospora herbaricolor]MDQ0311857.1 aldehyde dehydrogenase (NAD+) [Kitasatospora herbaricolor]GGU96856.1 aldehyde dehydrogenase [Kitasatospora herbaricolor]